jgi:predicted nucleotidyltransferase
MSNLFNDDFRDFITSLNENDVEYLLVGGYAVIYHGYRRSTGDMDIWVHRTHSNYLKLTKAFAQFGLPTYDMTADNFLDGNKVDVFSFGRPPVSIDIITNLKGVEFEEAFTRSIFFDDDGLKTRVIHLNNLIQAKTASGRHKDLDDIEKLSSGDRKNSEE